MTDKPVTADEKPPRPVEIRATTLADSIAKRLFYQMMQREGCRSEREAANRWASTAFEGHKAEAYRVAADVLNIAERWVGLAADGKLSTARTLRLPIKLDHETMAAEVQEILTDSDAFKEFRKYRPPSKS